MVAREHRGQERIINLKAKPEGEDGDAPGAGVPCGRIMVDVDFPRRNTPLDGPAGRGEESQSSATPGKGSLT